MHYYLLKVSIGDTALTPDESVISGIESFNGSDNYVMYHRGNEAEKQFIMVSKESISDETKKKLKSIFEREVRFDEIDTKNADGKVLRKVRIAKSLMGDEDNFRGKKKQFFATESVKGLMKRAGNVMGSAQFKAFLGSYIDYIDRTAGISANAMYNVAFIEEKGIRTDKHVDLLCRALVAKEVLSEPVVIEGDIWDANHTERDTGLAYIIKDGWKTDDGDDDSCCGDGDRLLIEIFGEPDKRGASNSDVMSLFEKIKDSRNIYITSVSRKQYESVSKLDYFKVAFPHVISIDELTVSDKRRKISVVAGEYGFTFRAKGCAASPALAAATEAEIEAAVRTAVQQKLLTKDDSFTIALSDLALKVKETKEKKTSAFDELEALVGLGGVKKTIKEITELLKKRGRNAVPCMHMVFTGNPGTGKTTVARIVARILAEIGVTEKDLLVETQRGGLIGEYLGQTAPKTAKVVKKALGGVLFIDEAYALINNGDETNLDGYGQEAIATLVKLMEDKRDEFVCILAGYTGKMNVMLDANPGLRDRIQFYIDFPDYSVPELIQIFEKFVAENSYKLTEPAGAVLKDKFAQMLSVKSDNFSNGRIVRKIFERVRIKQALRAPASDDTIVAEDIIDAFAEPDIAALIDKKVLRLGFQVSA